MQNKRYSLLMIALYCYPGHVKAVINHLKAVNPLVDITLLTNEAACMKEALNDKSVKIEYYDVPPVRTRWRCLMNAEIRHRQRRFFAKFRKGRTYDIVNVHFPNRFMADVRKDLRAMSDRLVLSPWGSDILRRDGKYLKHLACLYKEADYIATEANMPMGCRIINEIGIDPARLVGNFFGSDVVDYVLKTGQLLTTEQAKDRFGLAGRYVITCGYNARPAQRHKEMIAAIDRVRDRLPANLTLLFPMNYGTENGPDYIEECRKECEARNLPSLFVTEFLQAEELYPMRMATDMFIHVQTTDAYSDSVKEYILCEKKIVHGSWIKYGELEAFQPLFYYPVLHMEELGEVIAYACHADRIDIPQGVRDFVRNCGWTRKATLMNDFFMSIV